LIGTGNSVIVRFLPATLLLLLPSTALGADIPDLSAHRWVHRVLVVDTPTVEHGDYVKQAAALLPDWPGWMERELVVLTRTGAAAFRVRLVGKDGGVKLDRPGLVSAEELRALIDAMPMRRAEAAGAGR
jgi:hypothetical protein